MRSGLGSSDLCYSWPLEMARIAQSCCCSMCMCRCWSLRHVVEYAVVSMCHHLEPEARLPFRGMLIKQKRNSLPVMMQNVLPDYRSVTTAYFNAVTALGMRLLRLLALALDLPPEHFHPMFSRPMLFLRPLHYARRTSQPDQVHTLDPCGNCDRAWSAIS